MRLSKVRGEGALDEGQYVVVVVFVVVVVVMVGWGRFGMKGLGKEESGRLNSVCRSLFTSVK